jgi:hypothetical protein
MTSLTTFVELRLSGAQTDISCRIETHSILQDIVAAVEEFHLEEVKLQLVSNLNELSQRNGALQHDIETLRQEKAQSDNELWRIKAEAEGVRDALIQDVGYVLYESRSTERYRERIRELENRVLELSQRPAVAALPTASPASTHAPSSSSSPNSSNNGQLTQAASESEPPRTPMPSTASSIRSPSPTPTPIPANTSTDPPPSGPSADANGNSKQPAEPAIGPADGPPLTRLEDALFAAVLGYLDKKETTRVALTSRRSFVRCMQTANIHTKVDTKTWGVASRPTAEVVEAPPAAVTPAPPSKSKFSMLFAAADTVLPGALMNVVGAGFEAIGGSRDRSTSSTASTSSRPTVSTAPLPPTPTPAGAFSPLMGNGTPGPGDVLTREMAESLAKKLSCTSVRLYLCTSVRLEQE